MPAAQPVINPFSAADLERLRERVSAMVGPQRQYLEQCADCGVDTVQHADRLDMQTKIAEAILRNFSPTKLTPTEPAIND